MLPTVGLILTFIISSYLAYKLGKIMGKSEELLIAAIFIESLVEELDLTPSQRGSAIIKAREKALEKLRSQANI
jgi:hypothetical protein